MNKFTMPFYAGRFAMFVFGVLALLVVANGSDMTTFDRHIAVVQDVAGRAAIVIGIVAACFGIVVMIAMRLSLQSAMFAFTVSSIMVAMVGVGIWYSHLGGPVVSLIVITIVAACVPLAMAYRSETDRFSWSLWASGFGIFMLIPTMAMIAYMLADKGSFPTELPFACFVLVMAVTTLIEHGVNKVFATPASACPVLDPLEYSAH